ncbi:hypothetical protein GCK72_010633 [Caenorhabditis remanei]|uniref:Uncharacterized protein n=1 Tax=Caenorhabditis remanei TaxID=31234 RepID=A0A6A5H607_CAERE|nr:hypothetical protein GCK72_010633 [Caenorhabditis remanei]KAF1762371.1 hypothetical protein GCK72_010633 [Caenorhabditis remanei]
MFFFLILRRKEKNQNSRVWITCFCHNGSDCYASDADHKKDDAPVHPLNMEQCHLAGSSNLEEETRNSSSGNRNWKEIRIIKKGKQM